MKTEKRSLRLWKALIMIILLCVLVGKEYAQNIHKEIAEGNLKKVALLLKENPILVNQEDDRGRTPIFTAIIKKNQDMVKLLIENGATVRVGDLHLRAPIHFAGFMNDKNMISLLLKHGAVIDTRAIGAATPLIHSSYSDRDDMSRFLIRNGADINIQCNSLTTPLYFAVLNNNISYLKYLLEKGADIDTPDFLGRTPLVIAVRDGYIEIAKKLIEHGADVHFQDSNSGMSLLHLGAIQGHSDIVRLLIQKGLIVNLKDKKKYTPLDLALRYGHESTVAVLEKNGGKSNRFHEFIADKVNSDRDPQNGEAVIIKLQNGSWGIRTWKHFLIFGYSEIGIPTPDKSIVNGYLTPDGLHDARWVYFDMDYHPSESRFSLQGRNPLYSQQAAGKDITFVLNQSLKNAYSKLNLSQAYYPEPEQTQKIGDVAITVIPSYGYRKGYMVECDGLKIFWLAGICDNYIVSKRDHGVLKKAGKIFPSVDLMILGTPGGIGPEIGNGIRETYLESKVLNPNRVIFMGKSAAERRILNQLKRRNRKPENIYCSENPGDRFFFRSDEVK